MVSKRVWSLLLVLALAAGLLTGCGAAPETTEQDDDRPALVVGVDPFPPFAYIGSAGAPAGIDIDLATEAFDRMGYRAEFRFIGKTRMRCLITVTSTACGAASAWTAGRRNTAGPGRT